MSYRGAIASKMTYTKTNFDQQTAVVLGFITVTGVGIFYYLFKTFKKSDTLPEWKAVGEVKKLCIYPLKSGRRLEVDQAECAREGLMESFKFDKSLRLRDRSFVVYHEKTNVYVNPSNHPKLVLVEIRAEHMNHVFLNAPDMYTMLLRIPSETKRNKVVLKDKNEKTQCLDCGKEAAEWISQYLLGEDSGFRIAFLDESIKKQQEVRTDPSSLHVINQASVIYINRTIWQNPVSADYFRPNLVVGGRKIKHLEEGTWQWIKVGDTILKNVQERERCDIITINPETGVVRKDDEPLNTLRQISTSERKPPVMGLQLEVFKPGNISVGDIVYVRYK